MVKTPCSQCRNAGDVGLIPGQETKIPHAVWCSQKKKKKKRKSVKPVILKYKDQGTRCGVVVITLELLLLD